MPALHGTNSLGVEPISGSGKRSNGSCMLCSPLCGLYGVLLPTQDLGAQGRGQGWVLACAVRDCQVLHILFLWEMEAGNHQVSYFNDNSVKSMGTLYCGCHFGKLPSQYSIHCVLYQPEVESSYLLLLCLYFLRQNRKWLWMQSSWMSIRTAMV